MLSLHWVVPIVVDIKFCQIAFWVLPFKRIWLLYWLVDDEPGLNKTWKVI